MNLLLLTKADFPDPAQPERALLQDRRHDHVRRILHAEPGDELSVGLLGGDIGRAKIVALDREQLLLDVAFDAPAPPPLTVKLVCALPRPKFLGRILQNVTAMGVKEILLVHTARTQKSYWSSRLLEDEQLRRHLLLGLEQGRDTVLPVVRTLPRFSDLVAALPRLADDGDVWLAHGDAREPLPRTPKTPASILIGPEGGWLDHEVAALSNGGARPITFGPRPLRVEAAVLVGLARFLPSPALP